MSALDVGMTGVTALVVSGQGQVLRRGHRKSPQHVPQPGLVEHEPGSRAVLAATRTAMGDVGGRAKVLGSTSCDDASASASC